MRVFLRIPTAEHVHWATADWFGWVTRELGSSADCAIHYSSCFGIAEARNDIVQEFLVSDCTHLWFVDSDVVPPRTLAILNKEPGHPILPVCGPYNGFRPHIGLVWHVYQYLGVDSVRCRYGSMPVEAWPRGNRFFHADAAGTGCMVIPRELLESLPSRPFAYELHDDGGAHGTEDIPFCRTVGGVWVDSTYVCQHLRSVNLLEAALAAGKFNGRLRFEEHVKPKEVAV